MDIGTTNCKSRPLDGPFRVKRSHDEGVVEGKEGIAKEYCQLLGWDQL